MATLPDMWERTITIGSAGKTFSVTGWKLGWCIGPQNLVQNCQIAHQNCLYACNTPVQEAVARCVRQLIFQRLSKVQVVMLKNLFQGFRVRDEQNGHTGVLLHFNLDGLEAKAGLHRASAAGRRNEPSHPGRGLFHHGGLEQAW